MFTLTYTPGAYQQADNLQAVNASSQFESRPGFFQVVTANVNRAIGWNDACLMEIFGGVYVWHGGIFETVTTDADIPVDATRSFSGSRFQALQSLGNREERVYLANGDTIIYIHRYAVTGATVSGVSISPASAELLTGKTLTLNALIDPPWAKNRAITWSSSDPAVATVDPASGLITGIAPGNAQISATTSQGGFSDQCHLTVSDPVPVTGITSVSPLTININETVQATWEVHPTNASNKAVYWFIDHPDIISVSDWGAVTGLKPGATTIRLRTSDGNLESRIEVNVTDTITALSAPVQTNQPAGNLNRQPPAVHIGKAILADKFYEAMSFTNEFLDDQSQPYDLPKARFIATWRSRLWASDGSHLIYHCLNDNPHHWEPLDAIAIQGGQQSEVTGLCPMGNRLIVSTQKSIWQIVGDSPYNWEYQAIVKGHGAMNHRAMATDGQRLYYLDWHGVFLLGNPEPVSDAIDSLFHTPDYDGQLLLDARGKYLYVLLQQRLFSLNTYSGQWGEIKHPTGKEQVIKGLVSVGGTIGIYGEDGLWLMGDKYTPDVWHSSQPLEFGVRSPVASKLKSWSQSPNHSGYASLQRFYANIEGGYGGSVRYRLYNHGGTDSSQPAALDLSLDRYQSPPRAIMIQQNPLQVVYSEQSLASWEDVPVGIGSEQFTHELAANGFVKYHQLDPVYQFQQAIGEPS